MQKLLLILLCLPMIGFGQSVPQGINYQAVARDANGDVLVNQSLTIQFSVISDITTGNVSWQETHQDTTNDYGLFTAIIGQGISTSVGSSAVFDSINWGASNHLLKVEINDGTGYIDMGTTAFMSVPYSINTEKAKTAANVDIDGVLTITENEMISTVTATGWAPNFPGIPYTFNPGLKFEAENFYFDCGNGVTRGFIVSLGDNTSNSIFRIVDNNNNYSAGIGTPPLFQVEGSGLMQTQHIWPFIDTSYNIGYKWGIEPNVNYLRYNNMYINNIEASGNIESTLWPTDSAHLTRKDYVDVRDAIATAKIDSLESVISTLDSILNSATPSAVTYSIGDTAQGGIIFYVDPSGCHGLVAKATDEPGLYKWNSSSFTTWVYASGIYAGAQNTKKHIAAAARTNATAPAASVCDNLTSGGYTDWYLPSKDELDMMYVNLHLQGLGGFTTNGHYWSSTEFDSYRAWFENFNYGLQNTTSTTMSFWVRAVRAF